ncbi:MAG: NAD(P)/FAD-dependent oxidoreductase [Acetobacterium sp.]
MKIVIIGASAAGISAAKTLKTLEPDTEVVIISKDDTIHSRCMLHKYLGHHRDAQGISFVPQDFCEINNISWMKNTTVIAVEPQKKIIRTQDHQEITYDKLLITTGAAYFIPPVPGMREAHNVFGFRDLSDAMLIDEASKNSKNAIVVGAGLVGMDAAFALLEQGLKVTIIEMAETVLGLQLDNKAAGEYQKRFEDAGAKFLLSEKVVRVDLDDNQNAKSVHLASGKVVLCDFLVVAAGVRPSYDFIEGSGIDANHGITVGDDMHTNIADVYAAGDVLGISGIWPNAMKQGKIAATNMLGGSAIYDDRYAIKNTASFYGLTTLSLGNINPRDEETCEIIEREDKNNYQKIVSNKGQILGVIFQGNISNTGFWQYLIKNEINISGIDKPIFDLSYADFYGIDQDNGEYCYTL